jgi:hypothetical protein
MTGPESVPRWIFLYKEWNHFEVEVTLRQTGSRPVRLGVLPLLERVTRRYIYLSDSYFLYFSCRAPLAGYVGKLLKDELADRPSIESFTHYLTN